MASEAQSGRGEEGHSPTRGSFARSADVGQPAGDVLPCEAVSAPVLATCGLWLADSVPANGAMQVSRTVEDSGDVSYAFYSLTSLLLIIKIVSLGQALS